MAAPRAANFSTLVPTKTKREQLAEAMPPPRPPDPVEVKKKKEPTQTMAVRG